MVKRQFNKEERALALRSKARIEEEISHLKWLMEYNDLMLAKGYKMNYLEKMRAGRKNKRELEGDLEIEEVKLKELERQLKYGVDNVKKVVSAGDEEKNNNDDERGYVG